MSVLWPIVTNAIRFPHRDAVVDDRRTYSFGQLVGGAMYLAERIEVGTVARHVGILLPTSGAFALALLATWLARRVAIPLNYLLAADELRYVIENSDIDTIVTAGPMLDVISDRGCLAGQELIRMEESDFSGVPPLRWPPRYRADDLACILYTSGTSGRPKGVMLSHGNLRSNVVASIQHAQIRSIDRFLGVLPQFHSFGLTGLTLIPLFVGATVTYSARFIPSRVVELIRTHRPSIMMAVPSMYGALLSVKSACAEDFQSIRLPVSGGEPLPDATFDLFQQRFNLRLLEGYGLTETSPVTHWSTPQRNKLHSVGPCLPDVQVAIVDESDQHLPPNTDGEILITGPNIMMGYYRLSEQSAAVFTNLPTPDGCSQRYFRTGDIGRVDAEGFLYITGRKKEMLIIGGENVFPREIEQVLNKHVSVCDSAVVGASDGIRGEVPIAFVELNDGQRFDESDLRSWCRQSLVGHKVPRRIYLIDQLPRNATGKVLRRELMTQAS